MSNIGPRATSRGGSSLAWVGSRHAVANAHPGTLKADAFSGATGVENGVVPSGYPITEDGDGFYVPFTGEGSPDGFSIDDRDISHGDCPTAVLWHGRIIVDELPIDFTRPADAGAFVYA